MKIRRARVNERELLVELWERSVRATHLFLTESDIVGLRPLVAEEVAADTVNWWLLEHEETVIGFLGFANDMIEALFVDANQQGRGAGTLLVEHAQCLAAGALRVDVNEQNDAARVFYESRGFVVVARSSTDNAGRPFPLLHMTRAKPSREVA